MKFADKVYEAVRKIPKGKVATYKLIASMVGTKGYRAVGAALKCNPYAPEVPCHRVVRSDGNIGGFMGGRTEVNIKEKKALLTSEGVEVKDNKIDLSKYLYYQG